MTATASQPVNLAPSNAERRNFANELRQQSIAVRVMHEKLGVRKALTRDQLMTVAGEFDANSKFLSAGKQIIDTSDPSYRAVVSIRRRATDYWRSVSIPYPEPGVRLIRKDRVEAFNQQMTSLAAELNQAVKTLQLNYQQLRAQAKIELGALFNAQDYPSRIDDQFSLDWDFPNIDPPAHLKQLHPQLYEQECERIRGRFEEAVRLTEQAFTQKFADLITHLAERLKGDADGKPKTFKNASIENLKAFFEEFRSLDVGSSADLQSLVDKAQKTMEGVGPDELRGSDEVRNRIGTELIAIQQQMDELMISRPKRAIDLSEEE